MILDTHMETPEEIKKRIKKEIKEPLRIIHKKKWKFGETRKRLNKNEELLKRLKKELGQE